MKHADIFNPVQPECVNADAIRRRFGKRLTFDGCIGTQSTMPWGTPDEVRARVKEIIDKYGRNGGFGSMRLPVVNIGGHIRTPPL